MSGKNRFLIHTPSKEIIFAEKYFDFRHFIPLSNMSIVYFWGIRKSLLKYILMIDF